MIKDEFETSKCSVLVGLQFPGQVSWGFLVKVETIVLRILFLHDRMALIHCNACNPENLHTTVHTYPENKLPSYYQL